MANQLRQIIAFTNIGSGASSAQAHNININSIAQIPDLIYLDNSAFNIVSCTATTLTVTNNGPSTGSCNVYLEREHTFDQAYGNIATTALTPTPFIVRGGGTGSLNTLVASATAGANIQDLAISGLNGDLDGRYYLEAVIHVPASTAVVYSLRPNGVTTNLAGIQTGDLGGAVASGTWALNLSINEPAPCMLTVQIWIGAQTTVGGVAVYRTMTGRGLNTTSNVGVTLQNGYTVHGVWAETATNMTSLNLFSSVASGILTGSQVKVFRTASPFTA